jgi:hypothetical protein
MHTSASQVGASFSTQAISADFFVALVVVGLFGMHALFTSALQPCIDLRKMHPYYTFVRTYNTYESGCYTYGEIFHEQVNDHICIHE